MAVDIRFLAAVTTGVAMLGLLVVGALCWLVDRRDRAAQDERDIARLRKTFGNPAA